MGRGRHIVSVWGGCRSIADVGQQLEALQRENDGLRRRLDMQRAQDRTWEAQMKQLEGELLMAQTQAKVRIPRARLPNRDQMSYSAC
jgi:hypothetical protein